MFAKEEIVFGSRTKAQEILLLLSDNKEVVRQGFYDDELFRVEKYCQKNNLALVKANYKVITVDDDNSTYSNKGLRIPENDPRSGMHFVYISKSEEKAYLACYFETMNNHKGLGLLLGYPSCCIDFFIQNFNAANSNPVHWPSNAYTNLSKREQDFVIISHFPCNSNCEKSIVLGKRYIEVLRKQAPERAVELLQKLSVPSANPLSNKPSTPTF